MSDSPATQVTDVDVDAEWGRAQRLWGVRLRSPRICNGQGSTVGSFAWFGFPPTVSVDLEKAAADGALEHLTSVLAHEIGHHVLAPATRLTGLKVTHQIGRGLAACGLDLARLAPAAELLANLWSDLLINDRVTALQRRHGPPDMVDLWRALSRSAPATSSPLWWVVLRSYEILWSLTPGTLCPTTPPEQIGITGDELPDTRGARDRPPGSDATAAGTRRRVRPPQEVTRLAAELAALTVTDPEVDARLLAGLVRTFATDPIGGSLPFSVLISPYLASPRPAGEGASPGAAHGGVLCGGDTARAPASAAELEEILGDRRMHELPMHPALAARRAPEPDAETAVDVPAPGQGYGLSATLALYASSDPDAVLSAWYLAAARPHIRPLTGSRADGTPPETIPGPTTTWEIGDDLADLDWPSTLSRGVTPIPGITTRSRSAVPDDPVPRRRLIELDLYIDSSGSMPSPRVESPAVLAGTVLALSVLLAGGRVRVTSFSGSRAVAGTPGFTRHRGEVMSALTTYFGGGTTFPLTLLADRYLRTRPRNGARPPGGPGDQEVSAHLVVLSDDGLASMFGTGQPQFADVAARVRTRLADGTLVLIGVPGRVDQTAEAAGYHVDHVSDIADTPALCARLARHITGGSRPAPGSSVPHGR